MSAQQPTINIIIPILNEEKYINNSLFAISTNVGINHIKEVDLQQKLGQLDKSHAATF